MCWTQAKLALPGGRRAELPALVVAQALAAPVGDVEGRVGEDEVGLQVGVAVVVEGVAVGDLAVDAADGQVHLGEAPGGVVRLLAVDRDVRLRRPSASCPRPIPLAWARMNSTDWTNIPEDPQQGS